MQYLITHSRWGHDYKISGNNTTAYHVINSQKIPGRPDLTFYSGSKAAVMGVCRYRYFSSDMDIGLGDPKSPHWKWEQLSRESVVKTRYSFQVTLGQPRTFVWKETVGQDRTNYKLVEKKTNQPVALFLSSSYSTEDGRLDILVEYGPQFSFLVLLTFLALYEKMRRFKRAQKQPILEP